MDQYASLADAGRVRWAQKDWASRTIDLFADDRPAGLLLIRGFLGFSAVARVVDEEWRIDVRGFFRSRFVATDARAGSEVVLSRSFWWGKGRIEFPNGERYLWHRYGFWGRSWSFRTESDFPVITFRSRPALFRSEGTIEVARDSRYKTGIPLMAIMGLFVLMVMRRSRRS